MNHDPQYSYTVTSPTVYTPSNFFEKRMMAEKDRQICFYNVFYNGKKNGSDIFYMEKKRNIVFYYFQIYSKFNGYLFNIALLISSIITTKDRRLIIIALILLNKKNNFVRLQKMQIFGHFLQKKIEYLVMFGMMLLLCILIKQFLLYYDYIYMYYLYLNILLAYHCSKYNKYKKIENIYNNNQKFCKISRHVILLVAQGVIQVIIR